MPISVSISISILTSTYLNMSTDLLFQEYIIPPEGQKHMCIYKLKCTEEVWQKLLRWQKFFSWLWWWFHACVYISKLMGLQMKMCTLNSSINPSRVVVETKGVFETDMHILKYTANRAKNGRAPAKGGWAKRPGKHEREQSELLSSQQIPRSSNKLCCQEKKNETKPQLSK